VVGGVLVFDPGCSGHEAILVNLPEEVKF
jgi:hypothetical protein